MIEIIKRQEGVMSEKTKIDSGSLQISFNSWGHLAIRIIHSDEIDTLIVLNESTSRETMSFIKNRVNFDELPF